VDGHDPGRLGTGNQHYNSQSDTGITISSPVELVAQALMYTTDEGAEKSGQEDAKAEGQEVWLEPKLRAMLPLRRPGPCRRSGVSISRAQPPAMIASRSKS